MPCVRLILYLPLIISYVRHIFLFVRHIISVKRLNISYLLRFTWVYYLVEIYFNWKKYASVDYYSTGFIFLHVDYTAFDRNCTFSKGTFISRIITEGGVGFHFSIKKIILGHYYPRVIFFKPEWICYTHKN